MYKPKRGYLQKMMLWMLCLAVITSFLCTVSLNANAAVSEWAPGTSYVQGDLVSYQGKIYECLQPHQSLTGWEPVNVASLWKVVDGTIPPSPATSTPTVTPTTSIPSGSGYKVSGYVKPDFTMDTSLKDGFKFLLNGTQLSGISDANGYFEINNVPKNISGYTISISKANYLTRTTKNVIVSTDLTLSIQGAPIEMWAGDMIIGGIQDDVVNMSDVMEISKYFNSVSGDGKYNTGADINKDGAVNMADVMILVRHFNKTVADYPEIVVPTIIPTNTPTPTPTLTPTPTNTANTEYKIVGYLSGWGNWSASDTNIAKMTHINYAFAQIVGGKVSGGNTTKFSALKTIKAQNPNIKTLISVGGWAAEGFSDAAYSETSRTTFADSAVTYIKNNGFDGVDLDWEYPCSSEAGIKSRPEDKHNFTLLLQKIREKLDIAGAADGKHYLLTVATGASQGYVNDTELSTVAQIVDFINIMTYDFHNGVSKEAGHHTNLFTSTYDNGDKMSSDQGVQWELDAGVPANKIVLGCAFYGRGLSGVKNLNNGLYQTGTGSNSEYSYTDLVNSYIDKGGYTRYWDDSAKAPYLWNGSTFISYDDVESLGYKTSFIKQKGLGGAMFWEYTQDSSRNLLQKLFTDLRQ